MKKVVLAFVATLISNMTISAQVADSSFLSVETPVESVQPVVPVEVDYDATVLDGPNLLLPDSVRAERELQAMRELNPKDSLLEEKRLPEKRFFTVGAVAGLNASTYTVVNLDGASAGFGPGGQLGINCDIPLGQTPLWQYFTIQPELLFTFCSVPLSSLKVYRDNGYPIKQSQEVDVTDWFIQMNVPVTLKGSIRMGKGRTFLAVGPMFNLGLFGRRNSDDPSLYASSLLYQADPNLLDKDGEDLELRREKALYNDMDFSLYTKGGYDFDSGFSVSLAFRMGFVNLLKDVDYGVLHARTLFLNVGYNF